MERGLTIAWPRDGFADAPHLVAHASAPGRARPASAHGALASGDEVRDDIAGVTLGPTVGLRLQGPLNASGTPGTDSISLVEREPGRLEAGAPTSTKRKTHA